MENESMTTIIQRLRERRAEMEQVSGIVMVKSLKL